MIIAKKWVQAAPITNRCQLKCIKGFLNANGIVPTVYKIPPVSNKQITGALSMLIFGINSSPIQPKPIYNMTPVSFIFFGNTIVLVIIIPIIAVNHILAKNMTCAQPL